MTSTHTSSSAPADGGAAAVVERFNRTERWLHWAVAVPLILAMFTGLSLFVPAAAKLFGSREIVRVAHWVTGLASIVVPALVLLLGDHRRVATDVEEIDLWSADDRTWLRTWLSRRTGLERELPPAGRFNAGQKANAVLSAAALFWLGVTGVVLFPPLHAPFWLLENSRNLHNLTWFLLIPLVLGHVFLSAVYSPTRPGLPGMFSGLVPVAWLREHHPLDRVAGRGEPGP
ncbi:MAG: formate dehydrogenase subunit gamma [Chloroflexota bacterium]|jgi:formate dehydrogenase subunit gamma|nr:formate dehydrogenase subunit gamma [Chloroflexota bacterium]